MKTKKIFIGVVLAIILLMQTVLPVLSLATTDNIISIKLEDFNLYTALCQSLQDKIKSKVDGTLTINITSENLASITSLILENKEIENLAGLDKFSSLISLDLSGNKLTEESNLNVLSNLANLKELDLSSNKIKNIESIEALYLNEEIKLLIQDQEILNIEIVELDSNIQETTKTVTLPQIIKYINEDDVEIKSTQKLRGQDETNIAIPYPGDTATIEITAGKIDNATYEYTLKKGIIKLLYKVIANDFNRSEIDSRLIVIDSYNEEGIIFKDKNLYNAIKEQLTKGQIANKVLMEYTNKENLYEVAYDEEQVLVISKANLYNNITHLVLSNKQIEDLSGLEYFVALDESINEKLSAAEMRAIEIVAGIETLQGGVISIGVGETKYDNLILDLSQNYISDTTPLKTLEENKVKVRQEIIDELREKIAVIKQLNAELANYERELEDLKGSKDGEKIGSIKALKSTIYSYVKQQMKLKDDDQGLRAYIDEINLTDFPGDKEATPGEIVLIINGMNNATTAQGETLVETEQLAGHLKSLKTKLYRERDLEPLITATQEKIIEKVNLAYERYNNLAELIELISDEVLALSDEQIGKLTFAETKSYIVSSLNTLKTNYDNLLQIEKTIYREVGTYTFASKEAIDIILQEINSITKDEEGNYISKLKSGLRTLRDNQKAITEEIKDLFKNEIMDNEISGIRDSDMSSEMINFTTANLLTQSSSEILSQTANLANHLSPGNAYLFNNFISTSSRIENSPLYKITTNSTIDEDVLDDLCSEVKAQLQKLGATITVQTKGLEQTGAGTGTEIGIGTGANSRDNDLFNEKLIIAKRLENANLEKVRLEKVEAIKLSENNISDLSIIAGMESIKYLDVNTNLIMDTSGINGTNLEQNVLYLDLGNNSIKDIEHLGAFTKVKYLNLDRNIIDTEELSKLDFSRLSSLQQLSLNSNKIDDLSNLINQLKKLDAFCKENGELIADKNEVLKNIFNNISLNFQIINMEITLEQEEGEARIQLPNIFRQAEQYQPTEVRFLSGTTLLAPTTLQQGTITIVRSQVGEFIKAIVIDGGVATGTSCTVKYEITEPIEDPENPEQPENPEDPENPEQPANVAVSGITLDQTTVTIVKGGKIKINAIIAPSNATNKNVIWTTANEAVATVENGIITAVSAGGTTLTAKTEDGNYTATCQVNVQELVYGIDDEKGYILNISPNTNFETFQEIFSSVHEVSLYDKNGSEIEDTTNIKVATGMKIKLSNDEEFTLVVKGDVNGDGTITGTDSINIRMHRASESGTLESEYLRAADVNNDNKVNGVDSILIMLHRAGISGYAL